MELRFVPPGLAHLDGVGTEILVGGLFADERPARGVVGLVDWRLATAVSRLLARGFLTGREGEVALLAVRPKLPFDKVLVLGLGARAAFDEAAFRRAIALLFSTLEGLAARSAVVELPGRHVGALEAERAADILLELAASRPAHDAWTLVESASDQRRIQAHMVEERRRVRRIATAEPGQSR